MKVLFREWSVRDLIDSGRKRFLIDSYLSGRRVSTAVGRCGWVGYQVGSNLGGYLLTGKMMNDAVGQSR